MSSTTSPTAATPSTLQAPSSPAKWQEPALRSSAGQRNAEPQPDTQSSMAEEAPTSVNEARKPEEQAEKAEKAEKAKKAGWSSSWGSGWSAREWEEHHVSECKRARLDAEYVAARDWTGWTKYSAEGCPEVWARAGTALRMRHRKNGWHDVTEGDDKAAEALRKKYDDKAAEAKKDEKAAEALKASKDDDRAAEAKKDEKAVEALKASKLDDKAAETKKDEKALEGQAQKELTTFEIEMERCRRERLVQQVQLQQRANLETARAGILANMTEDQRKALEACPRSHPWPMETDAIEDMTDAIRAWKAANEAGSQLCIDKLSLAAKASDDDSQPDGTGEPALGTEENKAATAPVDDIQDGQPWQFDDTLLQQPDV